MGPITIFDKSALQSLSMDAVWLDVFCDTTGEEVILAGGHSAGSRYSTSAK